MKTKNVLLAMGVCLGGMLCGADGVWTGTINGTWGNTSLWQGGVVASGAGSTASINRQVFGTHRAFTFEQEYTLGNIIITDSRSQPAPHWNTTFTYTSLVMDGNGNGSKLAGGGSSSMTLTGGVLKIADNLTIENLTGNGGWVTVQGSIISQGAGTKDLILKATNNRVNIDAQISGDIRVVADSAGGGNYINLGNGSSAIVNTYTGGTLIQNSANLRIYSGDAMGDGAVTFNGGSQLVAYFGANVENRTIANDVILQTNGNFVSAGSFGATYSGNISGVGALTITNNGAANMTVTLKGQNSYQGGTVLAGRAIVTSDANLGAATGALTMKAGAFLDAQASFTSSRQVNMDGSATIGTSYVATVANLGGKITGAGALTKNYAGTLELSGNNNDYSGGTTVSGGVLIVSNTAGSATGTGNLTMSHNASSAVRLAGTGRIAPGAGNNITFAGNGTLDPRGTMTLALSGASKLVLSNNATIELTLGTVSDQIVFETAGDWLQAGPSGIVNVNITEGTGFDSGISYDLFEGLTTQGITWNVTGVDGTIDWNGSGWALNVVPEPSTYAVLLGLAVLAGVIVRRRRG